MAIGNGERLDFGLIPGFMRNLAICKVVSLLYTLCDQKEAYVADVRNGRIQFSFQRELTSDLIASWNKVESDMVQIPIYRN